MGMMETSPTTLAPLLLRNLITSLFFYADKSLLNLSEKYKLLEILRHLLVSSFLFFLRILPSLNRTFADFTLLRRKPRKPDSNNSKNNHVPPCAAAVADSGISRALSQLLSLVNDIPVSSRKYEVVRSLAERLIDDNVREGFDVLREVNRSVLSAAFESTLGQLEAAILDVQERDGGGGGGSFGLGSLDYGVGRVLWAVRSIGDVAWTKVVKPRDREVSRSGSSAEKLAAEVLWLGQKLVACGYAEEAVCRWASASNLAWLSLSAEPQLQGSLVKVSAFLFKHTKDIERDDGGEEDDDEMMSKKELLKQTKMKMLVSWLPLLCRATNGTDAPILSSSERAELERVLEELIDMLEEEEEQEKVLSLWLHHFTYCPSSDWPNLHACYARWCTASRKLLILR